MDLADRIAELTAECGRLRAALRHAVRVAGEAANEWDAAPQGMKAGKLLIALSGRLPNYRADIAEIHAALSGGLGVMDGEAIQKGDPDLCHSIRTEDAP